MMKSTASVLKSYKSFTDLSSPRARPAWKFKRRIEKQVLELRNDLPTDVNEDWQAITKLNRRAPKKSAPSPLTPLALTNFSMENFHICLSCFLIMWMHHKGCARSLFNQCKHVRELYPPQDAPLSIWQYLSADVSPIILPGGINGTYKSIIHHHDTMT